jgi:hypothetical protein
MTWMPKNSNLSLHVKSYFSFLVDKSDKMKGYTVSVPRTRSWSSHLTPEA